MNKHAMAQRQSWIAGGCVFGVAFLFALFTLQAYAADARVHKAADDTKPFNHVTTGFPLTGAHATAECGTCHVGGVFKGTPRDCANCHTKGKRILATSMSNRHIPTTQPCEICHNNTVTFYGVKFSHTGGEVKQGNCTTCHNGVITAGKPANHNAGKKLTESCDTCHRTTAWVPAAYNHFSVVGQECNSSGCHANGNPVSARDGTGILLHNDARLSALTCRSCHRNYSSFYVARYDHAGVSSCTTCHTVPTGHSGGATGTTECSQCHVGGTSTWKGALGAPPSNHVLFNTSSGCIVCHPGTGTGHVTGTTLHNYTNAPGCYSCHGSNRSYSFSSAETARWPNYHESSRNPSATDCSASGCHRPAGNKGQLYLKWD